MDELFFRMLLAGPPVLLGVGITCMLRCGERERRHMIWSAAVFWGTLALWIGGGVLLNLFGLAWRGVSVGILLGVVLISGGIWITQVLAFLLPNKDFPHLVLGFRWAAKGIVLLFAGAVLLLMLFLFMFACALAGDDARRVVEYQGQTLVEVSDGWLDPHYSYYEYHGPLVRGQERVYDQEWPINGWTY